MRPSTPTLPKLATMAACLGALLVIGSPGCGGSRPRGADASVIGEPEPDPTDPTDPANPGEGGENDAGPGGGRPDSAVPPTGGPPGPPSDTGPPPESCGGVTCPALFALVGGCRPVGMCTLNLISLTFCYANGIKVVAENVVPPNLVGLVKRADGSDCYRARVSQAPGSADRNVVWETAAGVPVASGIIDGNGNGSITCQGVTASLNDPTCVAVPSPQGCMPGLCF